MSKKILIFLSIALFLYLFDWFLNNDNENMIYVSDNDIDFLVATWNDQMQRPPSEEELKTIIENFIQNEVLYREALKLNLDRGDIIVKRRLVQKLSFLKQEEGVKIPNEKELKKFQVMQNEAVDDAKRIVADAHEAAERIRNAAIEKAKESIKRRENQAKAKIAASEAAVLAELRMRATSIAISASKEILVSELNDELNSSIIDESISQIKAAQ